jgi:hypothetical protein
LRQQQHEVRLRGLHQTTGARAGKPDAHRASVNRGHADAAVREGAAKADFPMFQRRVSTRRQGGGFHERGGRFPKSSATVIFGRGGCTVARFMRECPPRESAKADFGPLLPRISIGGAELTARFDALRQVMLWTRL